MYTIWCKKCWKVHFWNGIFIKILLLKSPLLLKAKTEGENNTIDYGSNKTRYGFTIADTWKPVNMSDINDKWSGVYRVSGSDKHDFMLMTLC